MDLDEAGHSRSKSADVGLRTHCAPAKLAFATAPPPDPLPSPAPLPDPRPEPVPMFDPSLTAVGVPTLEADNGSVAVGSGGADMSLRL